MSEKTQSILQQLDIRRRDMSHVRQIITILSLAVILAVFWGLKLTGIGVAGEAFCGYEEHVHTQECGDSCTKQEHVHDKTCYSNVNADIETSDDWDDLFADMTRGPTTRENVVLVAQSQLGYTESTLNFVLDENGERKGITRYGQWYGNPYGDWSTMFVSFCLDYAGAKDVPLNAGADSLLKQWDELGLYRDADEHSPEIGNIIFLKKHASAFGATSVAVIVGFDQNSVRVIEGDVSNAVAELTYSLDDEAVMGYGLVPEAQGIITLAEPSVAADEYTVWLDGTDGGLGYC